ncbi:protein kinase domain-containing protein [Chondromyces crocatus]|uniref:Protein kinase domain-containing protein n=1 Tax=Chondromyces crocatus TaxID=52 RepID=A0A0K1E655_CHOCO|nr:protein kinase [Chondromyces crocatus]AKT36157.1 uncharacterized protein CMC5_002710 [Chondromyces crocatus]
MIFDHLRHRAAELSAMGRTQEGVTLLLAAGDRLGASLLLEQACDFSGAAREALAAQDPRRAALLGALGGDDTLVQHAIAQMRDVHSRDDVLRLGQELLARGHAVQAAQLFDDLDEPAEAAEAYLVARDLRRAAMAFDRAGRPIDGARLLEAELRRHPEAHPLRLCLGQLLVRHGRYEAAVRALQQLPPRSEERDRALSLLARSLIALGFDEAAQRVRGEIAERGLVEEPADEPPTSAARPPREASGARREAPDAAPAQLLFGRYDALRELAVSPHARVFEARDRISGEPVAVKIFASTTLGGGRDALLRFEREAQALSRLRHPHVAALRAYHPEGPALVMAWMAGGSLADRMHLERVAPARAVEIASSLLGALGEAHRLGILHRDVKPSNVLFDAVGAAHLSDFGAAHLGDLSGTATAGAIGTFAYMSPEQRLGRPATLASDLFGVGAVLSELLTGEIPRPAQGGHLDVPPSAINPDLTPAHDAVVAQLLEEDPAARPEDAFAAQRSLLSLSWPLSVPPLRTRVPARQSGRPLPSTDDAAQRLTEPTEPSDGRDAEARRHDRWIARDVLVLPLTDEALGRARAFARVNHAALPTVLRVDRRAAEIWITPPRGRALADGAPPLSPEQRARLLEAVTALHEAGGAHGLIDVQHVYLDGDEVTLAFPRRPLPGDALQRDREALRHLSEQPLEGYREQIPS